MASVKYICGFARIVVCGVQYVNMIGVLGVYAVDPMMPTERVVVERGGTGMISV